MLALGSGAVLFVFWILLSGHFDPLLLGLGVTSVMLTILIMKRMNILDHESFPFQIAARLPAFYVYLLREVVKANIDVLKRILTWKRKSISPRLVEFELPQNTDLGRVIYANSITLTPGTVSLELTEDKVLVHALAKEAADDLSTGTMARAVPDRGVDE